MVFCTEITQCRWRKKFRGNILWYSGQT